MLFNTSNLCALLCVALGASVACAQPKTKGDGSPFSRPADTKKLQEEIDRLRRDLDAATREIAALKAALGSGKIAPEEGPLYRGRSATSWLAQLKDEDDKTRADAIEAIGVLARKNKKLIPVVFDALKSDPSSLVVNPASNALVSLGPDVLPTLIEMAKDKSQKNSRVHAIQVIGDMGPNAKTAVPVLAKSLAESDVAILRSSIRALSLIGPDAKDAIPDLVNALGDCNAAAGKPMPGGPRFGNSPGSINVMILDTLFILDPQLSEVVTRPRTTGGFDPGGFGKGAKGKKGAGAAAPNDTIETWISIHESLVKRYGKSK
jgi:HEAT repeats